VQTILDDIVVAIDGPSGSGKSSTSRGVAARLGLRYLDTGAMYRGMTWWMLREGLDVHDREAVAAHAGEPEILSGTDANGPSIVVEGVDVGLAIRSAEVNAAVSPVSAVPEVRERLVELQRETIGNGGIVVEGRDIGAVVAPFAQVKRISQGTTASNTPGGSESSSQAPATAPTAQVESTAIVTPGCSRSWSR
jgi:cytidylate kinase